MDNRGYSIEVKDLTKLYGKKKAVSSISFEVERGAVVGFLGPNGAGKSTTMRILCGLIGATSGVARIEGIPISTRPEEIKRHISFLPENNPLPDDARVIEYLKHRARLKEVPAREQKRRIDEVMDICELVRTAERKMIRTLSKGYRQRVGIADCLLGNPNVLIMDEPTIGLDPHQILSIRKLLKAFEGKMTVVLSSHILPEIEACCNRFIIINRGHIVAQGSSDSLRKEFNNKVTYHMKIKADGEGLEKMVKELDPGSDVYCKELGGGFIDCLFTTEEPEDFGEKIIERIREEHGSWRLRELVRRESTLEDVFFAATRPSWNTLSLQEK